VLDPLGRLTSMAVGTCGTSLAFPRSRAEIHDAITPSIRPSSPAGSRRAPRPTDTPKDHSRDTRIPARHQISELDPENETIG
jgi:hypothetical protein